MNPICEEVRLLLPWAAAGTLERAGMFQALDHVRTCRACRDELAFFTQLSCAANHAWAPTLNSKPLSRVLTNLHLEADLAVHKPPKRELGPVRTSANFTAPLSVVGTVLSMVRSACVNRVASAVWSRLAPAVSK